MVGHRVWLRGEQVTVTSLPYLLYGKLFVDVVDATGKVSIMMTPEQVAANIAEAQRVRAEMQAGFRRLRAHTKTEE